MWYKHGKDTVTIDFYVQPGAKRTEIVGLHGDEIKVRLASLPIDGQANITLLKFVAQLFDVPLRQVSLQRGDKSRHKKIVITGRFVKSVWEVCRLGNEC